MHRKAWNGMLLVLIVAAAVSVGGCGSPRLERVELPPDVVSLRRDVVAFEAREEVGREFSSEVSLEPIRDALAEENEVFLLHYSKEGVKELSYKRDGDTITAQWIGGETYLLGAVPHGRYLEIYGTLCLLDRQKSYLARIDPDLYERLCPVILCSPGLVRADALSERIPELASIGERVDFGDWQIGGFPSLCERCTGLGSGRLVYPVRRCWDVPPRSVDECGNPIFHDDFQSDPVGDTPSTTPSGEPPDDALVFPSASSGYVRVVDSAPLGSRAARIGRGSSNDVVLGCVTGGGAHTSGRYVARFKGYSGEENGLVPAMTIGVESSSGKLAAELIVDDLQYRLMSGAGSEVLSAGYVVNVVDAIEIEIDLDTRELSVAIDGTIVASNRAFLDNAFEDVKRLTFSYPPAILEAWGRYVVDDINICKL